MEIEIPVGKLTLKGDLVIPKNPNGIVIFVHGSGSSRKSPRNKYVASELNSDGFATLLFDLLTEDEESNRENVFDIDLLAKRLIEVTKWLSTHQGTDNLAIGYFGASTGAAAALVSAAILGTKISAVVSRGGRVDLAHQHLTNVIAPTLMIVGGNDREVLELNLASQKLMKCENELKLISDATHLFEEPGALEEVARVASKWFKNTISSK